MNFIVRPDEPGMRAPAGVELPVLTVPADSTGQDDWPESELAADPVTRFQPTVFGPKLRHVDQDGREDRLHADPDGAPVMLRTGRNAFGNWSFFWLVLLLLLGLAVAAWLWLPSLRQGS